MCSVGLWLVTLVRHRATQPSHRQSYGGVGGLEGGTHITVAVVTATANCKENIETGDEEHRGQGSCNTHTRTP